VFSAEAPRPTGRPEIAEHCWIGVAASDFSSKLAPARNLYIIVLNINTISGSCPRPE
jgi:hypothetical protein